MLADIKRRREDWLENNVARSNYEEETREWMSLWFVEVPRKIRNFLWRLARCSIIIEDVR